MQNKKTKKAPADAEYKNDAAGASASQTENAALDMQWFEFLVNIYLVFAAAADIYFGINFVSGRVYRLPELMYFRYGTELKYINLFYGVCLIALGLFCAFAAYCLLKRIYYGPRLMCHYFLWSAVAYLLYYLIASCFIGADGAFFEQTAIAVVIKLFALFFNHRYVLDRIDVFAKRHLKSEEENNATLR